MRAKKSLGQNFLRDEKIVERIASAVLPRTDETLIEVGPGEGVLTAKLATSGARVIAVELDDRLVPVLERKFTGYDNVRIVHGDILEVDMENLVKGQKSEVGSSVISTEESSTNGEISRVKKGDSSTRGLGRNDKGNEYRVVGNLPYYITSKIIRMFLELESPPHEMFFMVQKEVAERICAQPGEMSILSVSVQYYAYPEILFDVSASAFEPEPKVESAFVRITHKTENGERKMDRQTDTKNFFRLVKMGFSARRKTLANNLSAGLRMSKQEAETLLETANLNSKARAQDLSVGGWEGLARIAQQRNLV